VGQVKKRLLIVAIALGLWGLACLALPQALQLASERGTDLVWRLVQTHQPERRVVVVDIDDESLSQVGPWPWTRPVLADLVRKLDAAGAGLKLFDITFPDQREGTVEFSRALSEGGRQGSPAVLGQVFALRHESVLQVGEPAGALPGEGCLEAATPAQGVIANVRQLHPLAGHISPVIDADGTVRKVPAVVCYAGRNYTAISVAGLTALADQAPHIERGQGLWAPAWRLHLDALPGMPVALDEKGLMRVPFHQSRASFVSISASDVLQNKAPVGLLKGAVVLVGASAFGLSDVVSTALGSTVSGTEVHAQLLAGMLDGSTPYTPRAAWLLQLASAGVLSLALMALGTGKPLHQRRRVVLLPLAALAGAALLYLLHALALWSLHIHISWAQPALAVLLLGLCLGIAEHARSLHVKDRLYENLASYIPSRVAEKIALTVPTGEIEAQRSQVTILAADIRNFSAYCEARTPEDAARVLHRFYKTASEIIAAHGGVVEEMVGDSLLAVFDGPLPCPDHSRQALLAARQIWLRCGEELPNTSGQGLEPMAIGVGVESGTALLGSFGAANRRVHTVLGRTVTVALRLSDLTADLAYPILVGPGVAAQIEPRLDEPDLLLKPLGSFILPGLTQSGKIFTLYNLLNASVEQEQQTLDLLKLHNIAA
jgi:adenylate cyclase